MILFSLLPCIHLPVFFLFVMMLFPKEKKKKRKRKGGVSEKDGAREAWREKGNIIMF